jgi:hypothetical protein
MCSYDLKIILKTNSNLRIGNFRTQLETFGHLWTLLDTFGHIWTLLDTFGHFWTLLDTFLTLIVELIKCVIKKQIQILLLDTYVFI